MTAADKPLIQFGWLRALLFIITALLVVFALSIVAGLLLAAGKFQPTPAQGETNIIEFLSYYVIAATGMIGTAFIFRKFIDKHTISSMGFAWSGYQRHAAAGFFLGILILSLGSLVLVMLQFLFFTGVDINWSNLLYSALLFILVAFAEEIAFRGYILNNLMQSTNKWVALFVSALAFSLFHSTNDNVSVMALLNIFVAGFLLGVNYIFTRNLWFAIFLHFSWNFMQGPVLGYEVSGFSAPALFAQTIKGPDLLTGGFFGFEGSLICLLLNLLTCIFLAAYYSGYRTRTLPEFKH